MLAFQRSAYTVDTAPFSLSGHKNEPAISIPAVQLCVVDYYPHKEGSRFPHRQFHLRLLFKWRIFERGLESATLVFSASAARR